MGGASLIVCSVVQVSGRRESSMYMGKISVIDCLVCERTSNIIHISSHYLLLECVRNTLLLVHRH